MATIITAGFPKAQTGATTPDTESSTFGESKGEKGVDTSVSEIPPLGAPLEEKRFFFQRARSYNPDAIATLVCDKKGPLSTPFRSAYTAAAQCI